MYLICTRIDNKTIYAILLSAPTTKTITIKSLNSHNLNSSLIKNILLIGMGNAKWKQDSTNLTIDLPDNYELKGALVLKICKK